MKQAGIAPLEDDVLCVECSYNLRGLSSEAVCPECATPIARSLRGNQLRYCSEDYLQRLQRGLGCVQISIAGIFIVAICAFLLIGTGLFSNGDTLPEAIAEGFLRTVFSMLPVLALYGWWLLSTPDPRMVETGSFEKPRAIMRVMVYACSGALVIHIAHETGVFAVNDLVVFIGSAMWWLALAAWLILFLRVAVSGARIGATGSGRARDEAGATTRVAGSAALRRRAAVFRDRGADRDCALFGFASVAPQGHQGDPRVPPASAHRFTSVIARNGRPSRVNLRS